MWNYKNHVEAVVVFFISVGLFNKIILHIYFKNIPPKFHSDLIWNDTAMKFFKFFEDDRTNKKNKNKKN